VAAVLPGRCCVNAILPAADAAELDACEQVIEHGLAKFIEVGNALAVIRDKRLYRAAHATFEVYCDERWNLSRPRAYELIAAAGVVSAMADTGLPAPANERQARELTGLPEDQRAEVWQAALDQTDGKPTAAAVRQARAVMSAHFAEVRERQERELAQRQRDIDERLARDREVCEDDGWLHQESPVMLSAKLAAIADQVHHCRPLLRRDDGGQKGHHAAWAFGFFDYRALAELERYAPAAVQHVRADLAAAVAAYSEALAEAVKRAKADVARIEKTIRAAAGEASGVMIATQHHYRRPLASGWLSHSETVWHDPGTQTEAAS
jgi:hypothetical protein